MRALRLFYKDKDLVVSSATRSPKPVSQAAENITVITAKEIEDMNAHTVAEVLNRVTGLFVSFNQDFGATSLINIQGSEQRHVLVLLDGIPWNFLSEGSAETNSIPVGIIERIEIIRGPASSAWGSSLGGVINILTKSPGATERPAGSVKASYGERNTGDFSAQVSGLAGPVGYYLYAGRQDSDGLRDSRKFDSSSFYSKFNVSLSEDADLTLSAGFSKPRNKLADYPDSDLTSASDTRSFFTTASLDASVTPDLDLNLSVYTVEQKFSQNTDTLGLGIVSTGKEMYSTNLADERSTGANGRLVWTKGSHTAVVGIDADRGKLDQTLENGAYLQGLGAEATTLAHPAVTKWAFYANDTISLGRWAITPGIRYDDNSIVGSFVSPSLGLTCRLGETTLARASVARGFTQPPLSWTSVGGLFLSPNPNLKPEEVWSYQAGLESSAIPYVWLKGTVFYHDLSNEIIRLGGGAGPPTNNDLFVNGGSSRQQGFELEGETVPLHDFSASAGVGYVNIKSSNETRSKDRYAYNIGLKYDDRKSLQAQLFGHYIWWGSDGEQSGWVWDLNAAKKVYESKQFSAKLFATIHNLFNGDQYISVDKKNPERWLEAGMGISF